MSTFQKVMKYLAMALATFLAVSIVVAIVGVVSIFFRIFNIGSNISNINNQENGEVISEEGELKSYDNIDIIDIDHGAGALIIKSGETDKVTVYIEDNDNNKYNVRTSGGTLRIENGRNFDNIFGISWNENISSRLIITLPKDIELEKIDIDAGAGEIILQDFTTKDLDIDAGAGQVKITNVEAYQVDIDGGAGELIFANVVFSDSDISAGVGVLDFTGKLLNENDISAGVGEIILNIQGKREDYNIKLEKGLGEIRVDGQEFGDVELKQDNSEHSLDIEGGVGSVNVKFVE